jgi:orotidine-5'-phosphate decarboxylase
MELSLAGVQTNLEDYAEKLALMATDAGADGVVCSPLEVERLARVLPSGSVFVTPGIRSGAIEGDDQTRTMSAAQALKAGSTFIVIGRPVYLASDPVQALEEIGASL